MNLLDKISDSKELFRFVKYCMVGVLNTLLCLGVIFLCKSILGINPYVSNAIGYIAGVINSFLWNKKWVFKSDGGMGREAIIFVCGFGICYILQFAVVWVLNQSSFGEMEFDFWVFTLTGYGIATILGNIVYTIANFIYNRLITFRIKD